MRIKRLSFFAALFCGFLLAGLSIGRQLEGWEVKNRSQLPSRTHQLEKQSITKITMPDLAVQPSDQVAQSPAPPDQPAPSNALTTTSGAVMRQNNILLIGVDDLTAAFPRLESAWLVLYLAQTPHLTLMPIYPEKTSRNGKTAPHRADLAELFQSDPQGLPGPKFFSELKARGLWWSGYIIVDRKSLAVVIDLVGRLAEQRGEEALSPGILNSVPFTWKDPQGAYEGQAQIAQQLCSAAAHLTLDQINEIDDIFLLFSSQILSDIKREGAAAELVGMLAQGSGITCEFPSQSSANP